MQRLAQTGNVISLDAIRAERQQPALAIVEDYWDSLRGARLVPTREEIDPRALSGALRHTFVLERIAPGLARVRVAGSHISDLLGMEARGMPVSAMFEPRARNGLAEALTNVFDEPAVVQLGLRCRGSIGRPSLTGGMVLLPLADDAGQITRALGGIVMAGPVGRPPRRPDIRSQTRRTLSVPGFAATVDDEAG